MSGMIWIGWNRQYTALWKLNIVFFLIGVFAPFFIDQLLQDLCFMSGYLDKNLAQLQGQLQGDSLKN